MWGRSPSSLEGLRQTKIFFYTTYFNIIIEITTVLILIGAHHCTSEDNLAARTFALVAVRFNCSREDKRRDGSMLPS
jgi:hypothetical protein